MPQKRKPSKPSANPALYIRAPKSYHDDIEKLKRVTGLTKNAICLEILRHGIKTMLNEVSSKP
jgi:hypothetical protein